MVAVAGVGAAGNPLRTNVGALTSTTAGTPQFLREDDSLTVNRLDAGAATVHLLGGAVNLGANDVIADTTSLDVNGATLGVGNFSGIVGGLTLTDGTITGGSGLLTSITPFDLRNGSVGARLGGAVGLTKSTAGTVTLSGASTYTGTTQVDAGTLVAAADASASAAGAFGNAASAVLVGATSGSADAALRVAGGFTVGRAITVRSGSSGAATLGHAGAGGGRLRR